MEKSFLSTLFNPENSFFKLAQPAKRIPHIALSSVLIPLLFIMFGALLYQLCFVPLVIGDIESVSPFTREVLTLMIMFLMIILGVFIWVKLVEKRPFYTLGFTKNRAFKKYLFGFGTGVLMISAVVGLMALSGGIQIQQDSSTISGIPSLAGVLILLLGFIIQGGAEEITTRGWQFQVIGIRYKPWIGALVSSIFFAVLHGFNKGVSVLAVFNLFLFALLLVLYVMNDGSIWSACGWHSAWNWTMGNVFGLEVSGTGISATLFDLETTGHDLITGGSFGPEGSIFSTFVLLTGIILTARNIKVKN
ncbi:lysostaphin resistance A-like protein [Bacteroidota bacterium]